MEKACPLDDVLEAMEQTLSKFRLLLPPQPPRTAPPPPPRRPPRTPTPGRNNHQMRAPRPLGRGDYT